MNEEMWRRVRMGKHPGVVSKEGYRIVLLAEFLYTVHSISAICLDRLEDVYTVVQRAELTREVVREAVDVLIFPDQSFELRHERYQPFWDALGKWQEAVCVYHVRAIQIGLSVVMSKHLAPHNRKVPLRDRMLELFLEVKADGYLVDAEVLAEVKRPVLEPYFPLAMSAEEYIEDCEASLAKYAQDVIKFYADRDYLVPDEVEKEKKHMRFLAEYCVSGLSYRKLADKMQCEGIEGASHSNIAEAVKKLTKRMGVQFFKRR
ncbi:hypothetical protein [Deinococcus aestuarii]|uniref:hypothetical protein n=1 Tax=Deinococcus aestuarii TaxID=2774531 RepID=UPI001C0CEAD8|nr:hypothetical protein [Deinococcus aestuarii]